MRQIPLPVPELELDPPLACCTLCDGALAPFDRDYLGHRVDRCSRCGVKLMNPQYSDAWLQRYYAGYISVGDQDQPRSARYRSIPAVRRQGKRHGIRLVERLLAGTGRLLSVGCGDGLEIGVARDLGWAVEGQDVDPATTGAVARRFGVPVHCGPLETMPGTGRFDAVFLDQVLEHVKRPRPFLRAVVRLLRPGGVAYVGVPNIGSLANQLKTCAGRLGLRRARRGRHYATKHHLHYFTPGVLRRVLPQLGLDVQAVHGSPKPGRSVLLHRITFHLPWLDSGFFVLARRAPFDASSGQAPLAGSAAR